MKQKLDCVLLIDDDEPTNYLNKMILNNMGCARHIKVAQSGKEAIDMLSSANRNKNKETDYCEPDLILLDINMPAMDGWEFLDIFKMITANTDKKTVLVMLTTSLNPDDEIKSSGIDEVTAYKNKPLSREMMEEIISSYFGIN